MKRTLTGLTAVAIILSAVSLVPAVEAAQSSITTTFAKCSTGVRKNCVVDGDTLWINGEKEATRRLIELVNEGPFQLQAWPGRDTDRYGRKRRVLVRDGQSLGDRLVSEGLARTWSGRREPWCLGAGPPERASSSAVWRLMGAGSSRSRS